MLSLISNYIFDFEVLGIFCDQLSKELAGFFEAKDFLFE
jgi:hypothetical protein